MGFWEGFTVETVCIDELSGMQRLAFERSVGYLMAFDEKDDIIGGLGKMFDLGQNREVGKGKELEGGLAMPNKKFCGSAAQNNDWRCRGGKGKFMGYYNGSK